ncbi:hypothetical protein Q7C36_019300 [Tachysurus vachellii]|uniref:Uncharacterized protein n=1 Tax=Tachysurus vachellii TaxID=175792 RepID=A0AA88LW56_TACVA|nr:uncharacterized protein LOC132862449 isoform X1 [Tachysurus vachellii]KAK2825373.1 hypothetical protein Q7C36_019300 [Tachysurus vachellii]
MKINKKNQASPLHKVLTETMCRFFSFQIVQKRKREAKGQDDAGELRKPRKKRLLKNTAKVSDLQQSNETTVRKRKKKREAEVQNDAIKLKYLKSCIRPSDKNIPKRRKIQSAQEKELQKPRPCLEARFVVNAAEIPEFRPRPASFAAAAPGPSFVSESLMDLPVTIHGLSIPEYQSVYHSVVDSKLVTSTGQPCCYSLALGRYIKQQLWDKLSCPTMMEVEQVQDGEQVHYIEKFGTQTLTNFAPQIDLDITEG